MECKALTHRLHIDPRHSCCRIPPGGGVCRAGHGVCTWGTCDNEIQIIYKGFLFCLAKMGAIITRGPWTILRRLLLRNQILRCCRIPRNLVFEGWMPDDSWTSCQNSYRRILVRFSHLHYLHQSIHGRSCSNEQVLVTNAFFPVSLFPCIAFSQLSGSLLPQ